MRKISILAMLAVVLLFSGCGKDSGEVKLLESVTQDGETTKFEYDDKNRIVKKGSATISYKSDDLVIIDGSEYKLNGNEIIASRGGSMDTLTLEDGFITSIMPQDALSGSGYTFVDGNLDWNGSEGGSYKYKYDDKNSPFNCNTPKWVIQMLLEATYASKNNVIEVSYKDTWSEGENHQRSYQYEYDSDGFPTKQMIGTETIATFTYRKGKKVEQEAKTSETKTAKTQTSPSLVRTVEFNGKTISITGFQPANSGEDENIIDSLSFAYDGAEHTIRLPFREEQGPWYFDVSVNDYNFDNYMDIAILSSRGVSNQVDEIFIYSPKTKSYSRNNKLSDIMNVWVDKETKILRSHVKGGHAGRLYESSEYKWEKDELVMIQSENQDYDDASGQYIRITKTLKDGKWVEKRESSEDGINFGDGCPGNAKLPAILWNVKFEYDNKNRIVKIGATTIAYKSNDLIRVEIRDEDEANTDIIDFAINENTILAEYFQLERSELLSYRDYVMTVNKDGYIVKGTYYNCGNGDTTCRNPVGVDTYQYQGGNVTSKRSEREAYTDPYSGVTDEKRENVVEYKYDNKKSPFYNSNTPKWLMQYLSDVQYVLGTVASNNNVIEEGLKYEYDSDGFPTKRTKTVDGYTETTTFTYCN